MALATLLMLFVPSHRFAYSGTADDIMSVARLISNSWERSREVLFGVADQTNAAIIFSRTLFVLIIVLTLLALLSLFISVWAAIVAFKCFLSDDEEDSERARRVFIAFVPNRIVLCILSALGLVIATLPYLMTPLYAFTYSQKVTAVIEAPDALIVGGVLFVASCIISIICAPIEKFFDADIFRKDKEGADAEDSLNDFSDVYDDNNDEYDNDDNEAKMRIRRLFDEDNDKK